MCSNSGWKAEEDSQTFSDEDYLNMANPSFSPNSLNCTDDSEQTGPPDAHHLVYYYNPDSGMVYSTIRWAFLLHAYGFACLFFFLAFYAFFSILNLRSQLSTRPYMSTINSFLCLLGVSRAVGLFIDPYGLKKNLPVLLGTLIWDLGFPCLISSFSLIQIAFLQLTQLEVGPEKLRKKTCLSVVITIHFVTVIASAIYSNLNSDLVIVRLVFQLGFGLWGFLLCGSFLYAGKRVLGILGFSSGSGGDGSGAPVVNEKGVAGLMMAGMMNPGQNLASSLTAALAPTLLQSSTPKIQITDENDRLVSVASETSHLNDTPDATSSTNPRPATPIPGPSSKSNGCSSTTTTAGSSSLGHARPPSPVLPRKKSGTDPALRNVSTTLSAAAVASIRKKSLTWSETETAAPGKKDDKEVKAGESGSSLGILTSDKRKGSRKSIDISGTESSLDCRSQADSLLISGSASPDFTLQSILSHIAFVNQTALDYRLSRKLSRKNQVHKVIKFTSLTAILGVLLCIGELIRVLSPYGLLASAESPPSPWPWFALQTFCRVIEFAMGATVANITKQPGNRPHPYAYSLRHKHQRESLYL